MCMQMTVPVSSQASMRGNQCPLRSWMLGSPNTEGSSEKVTARTPRAALRDTSAADGRRAPRVTRTNSGTAPHTQGSPGGHRQSPVAARVKMDKYK